MDLYGLSHASWECVHHIIWIPKYRREVKKTLRMLVGHMDWDEKVESMAYVDHFRICLRIALRYAVSNVAGSQEGGTQWCCASGAPSGVGRWDESRILRR